MKKIYALLFLVMLFWGFNVSAVKTLVTYFDPLSLTAIRVFVAGITVLIMAYFMNIFRLPTKQELLTIGYLGIFNVIAHHVFLSLGLKYTSGVNAGLILGSGPLITMMLSILILHDKITRLRIGGFILGFIGIVITSIFGTGGLTMLSMGDLMVFISILTQAFSFILISKLNPNFDPRLLTGYMLVSGSIIIFIIGLLYEGNISQFANLFSWKLGSIFLFSAIFCTAFGHMTYNYAIKKVGPAESAIFINLNTLFALLGATVFLGDPILKHHIIGLILIIIGIFLGSGAMEYVLLKKRKQSANKI